MGTTPQYGWVFPDPTDLVKDLPADFELFADAVDDDLKGLLGGAAGQVLRKLSATDHDYGWTTVLPAALVPTGDAVYVRSPITGIGANRSLTKDLTYYVPVYLPTGTVDRIAIITSNTPTPTTGNTTRLGIYANTNGKPSTLILDAGTINPAAANTAYEITISQAVTAGIYWLAVNRQVTAGTAPDYEGFDTSDTSSISFWTSSLNTGTPVKGYTQSGVTGAFANATSLSATSAGLPAVWVRVA